MSIMNRISHNSLAETTLVAIREECNSERIRNLLDVFFSPYKN